MPQRLAVLMLMMSFAPGSFADERTGDESSPGLFDYGTVIDATPIVQTESWVEPCTVPASLRRGRNALLGSLVGGAIGHAVGHRERNKRSGVLVGALVGAAVGARVAGVQTRDRAQDRVNEECGVRHEEEVVVGYDVRYRYRHKTFTTRTNVDPGDTIRLNMTISPAI